MGKATGISWCDHTHNFWWGCTKVSPGCKNCYAEVFSARYKWDIWGPGKSRRTFNDKHNREPFNWNEAARKAKVRKRVFCGSMMDWAEDEAPETERDKIFPTIKATPYLDWLLLTKRADLIHKYLPLDWSVENYPNVWLGTSIENDDYVWRAKELTKIPAVVHFISAEPLLGPLTKLDYTGLEWLIVGGESGGGFREMKQEWAEQIRDDCLLRKIAFFYKQGSAFRPGLNAYLDGVEYKQFPLVIKV